MKVHRTIRYRLHPQTGAKHKQLLGLAGACRFVWNHFVAELRGDWTRYCVQSLFDWRNAKRPDPRFYTLGKHFVLLRRADETKWLQEYSANIVKTSLKPIETAYKKFYKGKGGLPKFKAMHLAAPSFPLSKGLFRITGRWLHVQKIGQLALCGHNPYPGGVPVSGTVKMEADKWYAYIVYEVEAAENANEGAVGIDRNCGQVTASDGWIYDMPDSSRLEARRRRYQRMMGRRQKGSRKKDIKPSGRYLRAKQLHRKTTLKLAHIRQNRCHRVSRRIADENGTVYLEDLNIRGMTKSAKGTAEEPGRNVKAKAGLNREMLKSGWGLLERHLDYKTNVIKVPAAYTSQRCHACGHIDEKNRRTQAEFECVECGHRDHADVNAALNIKAFGIGASARGGGGAGRPVKREIDTGSAGKPAYYCI